MIPGSTHEPRSEESLAWELEAERFRGIISSLREQIDQLKRQVR